MYIILYKKYSNSTKKKYCILPLLVKVLSFCKEVFKGSDKNAFKDFTLYGKKEMSLPIKAMFFYVSFFLKEFSKQFNINLHIISQ